MSGKGGNRGLELPMTVAGRFELTNLGTHCTSTNNETDVGSSSEVSSAIKVNHDENVLFASGRGMTQDVQDADGRRLRNEMV